MFQEVYTYMKYHKWIQRMDDTLHSIDPENPSPYHLEGSIWTHTELVIEEVEKICQDNPNLDCDILKTLALVHDIGKVVAYEDVPEKGIRKFTNHWTWSGNIFRKMLLEIDPDVELLRLFNLYKIVQAHHLNLFPKHIKEAAVYDFNQYHRELLNNLILADRRGRITQKDYLLFQIPESKAHKQPIVVEESIEEILHLLPKRAVYVPIGAPNSGKSYVAKILKEHMDIHVNGFDNIRTQLAFGKPIEEVSSKEYQEAHEKIKGSVLGDTLAKDLNAAILEGKSVYVDNTNLKYKYRKSLLTRLKRLPRVAIFFIHNRPNLLKVRNEERTIKIPEHVIENMYYTTQYPSYGEFDEIVLI